MYECFHDSNITNITPIISLFLIWIGISISRSIDPKIILESALRMSFEKMINKKKKTLIGNAVAISPTLALSALHGIVEIGHDITLRTRSGVPLRGKVILNVFEPDLVDIAVIELVDSTTFPHFTPVLGSRSLTLFDYIYIIGYKIDDRDTAMEAVFDSKVHIIEPFERSALFQSSYVGFDSLSGAGVVVKQDGDGFKVVGVHVASHDNTKEVPPVKAAKDSDSAEWESVSVALASIKSNIHGHSSYTIICEIARVPSLIEFLRQRGLISYFFFFVLVCLAFKKS